MKKIRIIKTPPGTAPEGFRAELIGITIVVLEDRVQKLRGAKKPIFSLGSLDGSGCTVHVGDVLNALETAKRASAWSYWQRSPGLLMQFPEDTFEYVTN